MLQYCVTIKQFLCLIFLFFVTSSIQYEFSGKYECHRNSVSEQIMGSESDYYQGGVENPSYQANPGEQHEKQYFLSRIPDKNNSLYNSYSFKNFFPLPKFHFRI